MPFLPRTHIEIINRSFGCAQDDSSFDDAQDDSSFDDAQDDSSFDDAQDDSSFDDAQDDSSFGCAQDDKGTVVKRDDAQPSKPIRFALFDFDGTISLIRTGWQGVMIPMMVDILSEVVEARACDHPDETEAELTHLVTDFVTRLTGKQTIYQMIQLAEEVKKRGGTPLDPLDYKKEYLRRLWSHIEDRVADLKAGRRRPDDLMLPGARDILEAFRARDIQCYLASGTDRPYVLDEAAALGLTPYFGPHIYGALDDYENFSKRMVIRQILEENALAGPELIAFGDGFVEIEDTKAAGGTAIGVASDEAAYQATGDADLPKYPVDAWKRERLIQAGADIIIPNFLEYKALMEYLKIY